MRTAGKLPSQLPGAQLEAMRREVVCVDTIVRGGSYEDAAKAAGYTNRGSAFKAVKRALKRASNEAAAAGDELRQLEVKRLDKALAEIMAMVTNPHYPPQLRLTALEALRRNVDTRAKLLGLFAPEQHEVFTVSVLEQRIAQLSNELGMPYPTQLLEPSKYELDPGDPAADPADDD